MSLKVLCVAESPRCDRCEMSLKIAHLINIKVTASLATFLYAITLVQESYESESLLILIKTLSIT